MKRVIFGIGNMLLTSIFLIVAAVILMLLFGIRPYIVLSDSMQPTFGAGSFCFVNQNVAYEDIKQGDIIAFRVGKSLATHRVVDISEKGMETKGDANKFSDGISTNQQNYIGKNIISIPYLGYVVVFFQQKRVRITIITFFIGMMIAKKIVFEWKKEKNR